MWLLFLSWLGRKKGRVAFKPTIITKSAFWESSLLPLVSPPSSPTITGLSPPKGPSENITLAAFSPFRVLFWYFVCLLIRSKQKVYNHSSSQKWNFLLESDVFVFADIYEAHLFSFLTLRITLNFPYFISHACTLPTHLVTKMFKLC